MKHNFLLTLASLLSIVLLTFHLTGDIVRGYEKGGLLNLTAVPMLVVWLYGALLLAERRSGHIIMLVGSLLAMVVPIIHMKGRGVGLASSIPASSGGFFFIWTMIALGVTGLFSFILAVRGLWSLPWRRSH
jgi:hypothetical protein